MAKLLLTDALSEIIQILLQHEQSHPKGGRIITGAFAGTAKLWNAKTEAEKLILKSQMNMVAQR
jgi:hypothetical protein